jgi:hypothetical protein
VIGNVANINFLPFELDLNGFKVPTQRSRSGVYFCCGGRTRECVKVNIQPPPDCVAAQRVYNFERPAARPVRTGKFGCTNRDSHED